MPKTEKCVCAGKFPHSRSMLTVFKLLVTDTRKKKALSSSALCSGFKVQLCGCANAIKCQAPTTVTAVSK